MGLGGAADFFQYVITQNAVVAMTTTPSRNTTATTRAMMMVMAFGIAEFMVVVLLGIVGSSVGPVHG